MQERPYTQFYAGFLGGFSFRFQGESLQLDGSLQSKTMQLMLILLKAGPNGMARKKLMRTLWQEDISKRKEVSNLNQQVYLLRKRLANRPFPPGKYIVQKDEIYYFSQDYQLETDTGYLDGLLKQIRDGTQGESEVCTLLRNFCRSYKGEFLPMLHGEEWVTVESAYYQTQYFNCLSRLCEILKKQGSYEEMLELCTAASQMYPYDEWQAVQIDCLMSMQRYREALKVYEEAAELLYEDIAMTSIEKVMDKYRDESGQFFFTAGALNSIKEKLNETGAVREAFCCSYPSFVDLYRILMRMGVRSGRPGLLMLCTLHGGNTGCLESSVNCPAEEKQAERFRKCLAANIRCSDVYTRYSPNQFLVLLTEAENGCEEGIIRRLKQKWNEINGDGKTEIEFMIQKVEGPDTEECWNEKKGIIHNTYFKPGKLHLAGTDHLAG